jgi:dihydrofolate synthase / folylpolyglutamate synthase
MKLLNSLLQRRQSLMRMDLEYVNKAYLRLNLKSSAPTVIVAGTNGKGSTSGFLSRLFAVQKIRCGLFTSPHLVSVSERIWCSNKKITENYIDESLVFLQSTLGKDCYESLSFFEIIFLASLLIFSQNKNEINIFEVGLGGRLDATNILPHLCSCVVSIGKDHSEWLGNSLCEIAGEKLSVARKNCPLFFGDLSSSSKKEVLLADKRLSRQIGYNPYYYEKDYFYKQDSEQIFLAQSKRKFFPLPKIFANSPSFLRKNFSLSLAMYHWLLSTKIYPDKDFSYIDDKVVRVCQDFSKEEISWPSALIGRCQNFVVKNKKGKNFNFILDVCHNLDSLKVFKDFLLEKYSRKRLIVCVSIFSDKDVEEMLAQLKSLSSSINFFRTKNPRCCQEGDLEHHQDLKIFPDFSKLWNDIKTKVSEDSIVVVCGSFSAVGGVLEYFKVFDFETSFSSCLTGSNPL